jgi:hypothetical protein
MITTRRIAVLCLAAAALLGPAASASADRLEVGVQDEAVFLQGSGIGRDAGLDRARQMGATHIRTGIDWETTNFAAHDALVNAAAARGLRLQLTLTPAPGWVKRTRRTDIYKPRPGAFAAFARRVARHFRGRVFRYSVMNEPNWHAWLRPHRSAPRLYRAIYRRSYAAIKSVDRRNQVLFGELAPHHKSGLSIGPLRFMRAALCVNSRWRKRRGCKPLRADGLALHPYEFRRSPTYRYPNRDSVTIGTLGRLTSALRKLRRARALVTPRGRTVPVYLTEFGYFASGKRRLPAARRAAYLRQAYRIARRTRGVRQLVQYQLVQTPGAEWNTGVIRANGRPEAAFFALTRAAAAARR